MAPDSGIDARCTSVVGLQWGDEGKGKLVDLLAPGHAAVIRYNGGANAGHSIVVGDRKLALHLAPSGVLHQGVLSVIGNGVVVDPAALIQELDLLHSAGVDVSGVRLSDRAHVVMPYHLEEDATREQALSSRNASAGEDDRSIGTTRRGIGPTYAEKMQRVAAVRVGDLYRHKLLRERIETALTLRSGPAGATDHTERIERIFKDACAWGERLKPHITDSFYLLRDLLADGKKLLFEGANGALLDIDHGSFPYVTSSNSSTLGIGPGTGLPDRNLARVIGVAKAYTTRVGAGPFPTELSNEIGERIRTRGKEFGTTTGRPRRTGWLDLVALRYAAELNGCTELAVTLLDVLAGFESLRVCTAYRVDGGETDRFTPDASDLARVTPVLETLPGFSEELTALRSRSELPAHASAYIAFIEEYVGVPAKIISIGPDRAQTLED